MLLVDYSSSESDMGEGERPHPSKRRKVETAQAKAPPPLPPSFHSLYATNVRNATADDPSLHGGRSRQVPHIEGNWPSHVYLEWLPSKDNYIAIEKTISKLQDSKLARSKIVSFLKSDLHVQLPLHVSLSAPLVLKSAQKDEFRKALIEAIASSGAHRFSVTPVDIAWVPNLDQSRFFLVLKLSKPENDDLNKMLSACNACAKTWGLDLLYKETFDDSFQSLVTQPDTFGAFHISIAWTLQQPVEVGREVINARALRDLAEMVIDFSSVKIKIGNVVTDVQLSKSPRVK